MSLYATTCGVATGGDHHSFYKMYFLLLGVVFFVFVLFCFVLFLFCFLFCLLFPLHSGCWGVLTMTLYHIIISLFFFFLFIFFYLFFFIFFFFKECP